MREIQRFSNELNNMKRHIDRIVNNFWREDNEGSENGNIQTTFTPPVNAVETENEIKLYALIPFAKKEEINLNIKENVISIEGKTNFPVSEKDELLRDEIPYGNFSRTFKIGYNIDSSKIKASFKEGILEIILPKKEEAKNNKITIE